MADRHILIDDILSSERERMLYLKKYYPFFVLSEISLSQYKEGQYRDLDLGYITMALLRFLIEENHFNARPVHFREIERFLIRLIRRDFPDVISEGRLSSLPEGRGAGGSFSEEQEELVRFIFDKIRNDGRPFTFGFYDPETRSRRQGYVRLVESSVQDGEVVYSISADGIEFYLSTKEIRDESNISTEQVLLEKMIRTENFRGGIDVIRRINLEVELLKKERELVVRLLRENLSAGIERTEEYMGRISKWFEQERQSFQKNKVLVDKAVQRLTSGQDIRAVQEITTLETELKKTIENHRMLMEEAAELSRISGEMLERAKLRGLRPAFDFRETLLSLTEEDRPAGMLHVLSPFLLPRRRKSLSVYSIEKLLQDPGMEEEKEKREKRVPDPDFIYEDEKLSRMIGQNFTLLFRELLERLERWGTVTLPEFNAILETKLGREVYRNRDYYAFLVHLAKKELYRMKESFEQPETFLEAYAAGNFSEDEKKRFETLSFAIEYGTEEVELWPGSAGAQRAAEGSGDGTGEDREPAGTVRMMTFRRL